MVVWKFPLKLESSQVLCIPKIWKCLSLQVQDGVPCMWALVNPDNEETKIEVEMFGTGHGIPFGINHTTPFLGTVQTGPYVWHYFWRQL